jgi:hypothetical protein
MVAMATNTQLHVAPVVWPRIARMTRIRIKWIPHSCDSNYSWSKKRSIVLAEIRFPEWSDQITVAQGSNKIESPDGCNGNEHTAACCTSGLTTNNTNDTNKNTLNPTFVWFDLFVVQKKERCLGWDSIPRVKRPDHGSPRIKQHRIARWLQWQRTHGCMLHQWFDHE